MSEFNRSGVYYALIVSYLLSILGILTAFSTTLLGLAIAVAVLFISKRDVDKIFAWRNIYKNILISMFGLLPIIYFFGYMLRNMGDVLHAPVSDLGWGPILLSLSVALMSSIVVLVLIIGLLIDLIKYWDVGKGE